MKLICSYMAPKLFQPCNYKSSTIPTPKYHLDFKIKCFNTIIILLYRILNGPARQNKHFGGVILSETYYPLLCFWSVGFSKSLSRDFPCQLLPCNPVESELKKKESHLNILTVCQIFKGAHQD